MLGEPRLNLAALVPVGEDCVVREVEVRQGISPHAHDRAPDSAHGPSGGLAPVRLDGLALVRVAAARDEHRVAHHHLGDGAEELVRLVVARDVVDGSFAGFLASIRRGVSILRWGRGGAGWRITLGGYRALARFQRVDGTLAGHIRGAGSPTARPWTGDGVPRQRTRDETLVSADSGENAWFAGNWIASFWMSMKSWL